MGLSGQIQLKGLKRSRKEEEKDESEGEKLQDDKVTVNDVGGEVTYSIP